MITPIWTMKISEIVERHEDLLVSADDIKEMARNERANVLDEFVERFCTVCCGESMGVILGNRVKADMLTVDGACELAFEIAETLKGE